MKWSIADLLEHCNTVQRGIVIKGKTYSEPVRPLNSQYTSLKHRLKNAWGVITRRYDAVEWPNGQ